MLLKEILTEDATISAGNFAGFRGSLFGGGVIQLPINSKPKKKKSAIVKVIKYNTRG